MEVEEDNSQPRGEVEKILDARQDSDGKEEVLIKCKRGSQLDKDSNSCSASIIFLWFADGADRADP